MKNKEINCRNDIHLVFEVEVRVCVCVCVANQCVNDLVGLFVIRVAVNC